MLPETAQALEPGMGRAEVADTSAANIVLPHGRLRTRAPLFFEAVSIAVFRAAAEVESLVAALHGPFQQVPIEEHIGVTRPIMTQRACAWALPDAPTPQHHLN